MMSPPSGIFERYSTKGGAQSYWFRAGRVCMARWTEVLGHFRRYTEEQLCSAATLAGFRVEQVLKFNRIGTIAWWLNGRVLRKKTFGLVQIRVLNILTPIFRLVDPGFHFLRSRSSRCCARKRFPAYLILLNPSAWGPGGTYGFGGVRIRTGFLILLFVLSFPLGCDTPASSCCKDSLARYGSWR